MAGFWVRVSVVLVVGVLGALVVLWTYRNAGRSPHASVERSRSGQRPDTPGPQPAGPAAGGTGVSPTIRDAWLCEQNRCEQAVRRAARAVDTVSSERARRSLRRLVHRMDAELPYVRALVELGRRLEPTPSAERDAATARVHRQLVVAATRFDEVADELARSVAELVADADLGAVRSRTDVLRERFPLVPSMSALAKSSRGAEAPIPEASSPEAPDSGLASATR